MASMETELGGDDVRFRPTLWGTILRARDAGGEEARAALGRLADRYWKPLYFFLRRQGHDVETAKDLVQGFFERILEKDDLKGVAPEKGRFRNWLLVALRHFVADEQERARALKRGGGRAPADFAEAERVLAASTDPADVLFVRAWATELLDRCLLRLRVEWDSKGRAGDFDALARHLSGATGTYKETADRLGVPEHEVKNRLHAMRKRLREFLREEVMESLDDPSQVDQEIADLFSALGR